MGRRRSSSSALFCLVRLSFPSPSIGAVSGAFLASCRACPGAVLGHQSRQQGGIWIGVRIGLLFGSFPAKSPHLHLLRTGLMQQNLPLHACLSHPGVRLHSSGQPDPVAERPFANPVGVVRSTFISNGCSNCVGQ